MKGSGKANNQIGAGLRSSFALALCAGLLLVATFPKLSLTFLCWVALVPLLVAADRAPRLWQALAMGCLSGFVFFAGALYWVRPTLVEYGGLSQPIAVFATIALAAVWSQFFAAFAGMVFLLRVLPTALFLIGVPACWVAVELARAHLLTGFPWLLLGYALADHLIVAQLAAIGGVYLLSFVVALANTWVLVLIRRAGEQAPAARKHGMAMGLALFALAILSWADTRLPQPSAPETVYMLQAQVPVDVVWQESWNSDSLHRLLADFQERILGTYYRNRAQSGLVLWPEIPVSLYYHDDELVRERLHYLARQTQSGMLVNVIAWADAARERPFNSAVLIGAAGNFEGRYDKIHLVPFGEYVPYKSVFFFAGKLTAEVGEFVPGKNAAPLGLRRKLAPLICYEGIFPDLVRKFSAGGAEVLVNISNDGWYGQSAARDQLLLMSRLRAVENGRWLLRATNTGITAIVDPFGRAQTFPPDRRAVYIGRFEYRAGMTPYVAGGYWFPWVATAAAVALGAVSWKADRLDRRQKKKRKKP